MKPRERQEQWAVDVRIKAALLRGALQAALASPENPPGPRRDAVRQTVEELIALAESRLHNRPGWRPWARVRGTTVSTAYQSLHAAEVAMVELMSPAELAARRPAVIRRAQSVLDRSDPQRSAIESLATRREIDRPAFREAMAVGFDASDLMHVRVRNFRNLLWFSGAAILVFMGLLVTLVALQPEVLPMCFEPDGSRVCPSGAELPTGVDAAIVAGLGLLGGALAAAFSIRKLKGTSTPYDVPIAVAMLKPPLGALTAVAGVLLLRGDFVPGLSELDNQAQILAYALVLGYAQQAVSRLIDDQAQSVLSRLPGKDPDGDQPQPSAPAPIVREAPVEKPRRGLRARVGRART